MTLRVLTVWLLTALILVCGRDEARDAAQQSAAQPSDRREVPQDGGTLVRRLSTDITTLNPVRASTGNERYVNKYLYTPIVYLGRDLEPVPGLAESWTISPDGLVYRFELNDKATFSDGSPVRAGDVLFTLRKIADPASDAPQIATFFEELDLSRSRAIGDHTVEIAFRQPLASQLIHFADVPVLPEHVYAKGHFNRDFNDVATGSGPYRLVKHEPGTEIVLERRADYWRERPPSKPWSSRSLATMGQPGTP